jgi:hypothetical protein
MLSSSTRRSNFFNFKLQADGGTSRVPQKSCPSSDEDPGLYMSGTPVLASAFDECDILWISVCFDWLIIFR